jgi:hypothetical protein
LAGGIRTALDSVYHARHSTRENADLGQLGEYEELAQPIDIDDQVLPRYDGKPHNVGIAEKSYA